MKFIALMPVRNEAWMVGLSLRVALLWCDEVVALDHASTDRTPEILAEIAAEHPGRLHILHEPNPDWPEMAHRQRLLEAARALGGTHMAIIDADEVLTGNLLGAVREVVSGLAPGQLLQVGMPCMWRGLDQYRTDSRIWSNRNDLILAFADRPDLHWSQVNGYDHHHRAPCGAVVRQRVGYAAGGAMHLQWASWRRLTAKHALYKMMERRKYPDKSVAAIDSMYSLALDEVGLALQPAPAEWWAPYSQLRQYADINTEPWQESECRRLWAEHGAAAFAGLNLFGVVQ